MKLAVIPARGGSKRIPRKNVKLFHGKPMIQYAIEAAKKTSIFDYILVSTDDLEIQQIAIELGANAPFLRPSELSGDLTPTVPVIAHAIEELGNLGFSIDEVCCIYPCVPFLTTKDLDEALTLLVESKSSYVFPVASYPSPVQRALQRFGNGKVLPLYSEYTGVRTQDLKPAYYDAGQFYWGRKSAWLKKLNVHLNASTVLIPEWRVVDIDTLEDWERAEILYSTLFENNKS